MQVGGQVRGKAVSRQVTTRMTQVRKLLGRYVGRYMGRYVGRQVRSKIGGKMGLQGEDAPHSKTQQPAVGPRRAEESTPLRVKDAAQSASITAMHPMKHNV